MLNHSCENLVDLRSHILVFHILPAWRAYGYRNGRIRRMISVLLQSRLGRQTQRGNQARAMLVEGVGICLFFFGISGFGLSVGGNSENFNFPRRL